MPDVRDYVDYREYLAALVSHHQEVDPSFSFRGFARKAGLASPNYLQQVINRNRNLAPASVPAFVKGFGMKRAEARVFHLMVEFDAARTDDEKNGWCDRLLDHDHGRARQKVIAAHRLWYPLVIRDMAGLPGFQADPAWIASHLRPAITEFQARRAVELLFDAGLLECDDEGAVRPGPGEPLTEPLRGLADRNLARARAELAAELLRERVDAVRLIALRLTPAAADAANDAIERLVTELQVLSRADGNAEDTEIHQVVLALLPITVISSD